MKSLLILFLAVILSLIVFDTAARAQVASSSPYTIDQAVVAPGGGTSSNASIYKIDGTSGQTAAGTFAFASGYSIRNGFWTPSPFAPTAAGVNISGRVTTANGAGIRNVIVVLTGGNLFTSRSVRTGTFGSFMFEDVTVGQIYTVSVESKKYRFAQSGQVISLLDNVTDLVFQANWEN